MRKMQVNHIFLRIVLSIIISLGLLCFPYPVLTFKYNCTGNEPFPVFFGSPVIYKSSSLVTSLAFDYYIFGFIIDFVVWTIVILLLGHLIQKIVDSMANGFLNYMHKGFITIIFLIAILNLTYTIITSSGTNISLKMDLKKESELWKVKCKGEFIVLDF